MNGFVVLRTWSKLEGYEYLITSCGLLVVAKGKNVYHKIY